MQTLMSGFSLNLSGCRKSFCPKTDDPLCDSQGITHKNDCVFAIASCQAKERGELVRAVKDGVCESEEGTVKFGSNELACNENLPLKK